MPSTLSRQFAAVTLGSLLALTACSKSEKEKEPVVSVQIAKAQRGSISQVITTDAVLFPKNQAAITPKVNAPVRKFLVNRGAKVKQGQLLAILENRDLAAAVVDNQGAFEQAQAAYQTTTAAQLPEDVKKSQLDAQSSKESYDAQQKLYDSRKVLFDQGALPRKDLDQAAVALVQAKAAYQLAQQHLEAITAVGAPQTMKSAAGQLASAKGKFQGASAQLIYSEIRSPIDGIVTDRPVYPGETPAQGTPLITVMDTTTVIAKAHIPQDQAAQLKVGDVAKITAPGAEDIDAKVSLVSPATDPNSTTIEVWVQAANPKGLLRPGTSVHIEIVAQVENDAILIPATGLLKTPEGGTSVMLVSSDNKAHQTDVTVGIRNGDQVQITKGLKEGDSIVADGAYGLPDNTSVKPVEAAKPDTDKPDAGKPGAAKPTADKDKD
jgi:HlyD family secretion protein